MQRAVTPTPPTFPPLTNRSEDSADGTPRFTLPADGFIQIVPLGVAPIHRHNGKVIVQHVDATALEQQLTNAIALGGEMLIDFEHFSRDPSKATDSAAWLPLDKDHLQVRPDGLYGKPRWTTLGNTAVTGGTLRHISPEFSDMDEDLQPIAPGSPHLRPLRLVGAGLTNRPNFRAAAKPLTNRIPSQTQPNPPSMNRYITALATLLSLDPATLEAMDDAALTAAIQTATDAHTATTNKITELQNREVDMILAPHTANLPKDTAAVQAIRNLILSNRAAADALLASLTPAADLAATTNAAYKPLHNRDTATPPEKGNAPDKVSAAVRQYQLQNKCSFQDAWSAVKATSPALFE